MKIKVFGAETPFLLEQEVNKFLQEIDNVNIISTHFSTNGINHQLYDTDELGPTKTKYHAAIYYKEI